MSKTDYRKLLLEQVQAEDPPQDEPPKDELAVPQVPVEDVNPFGDMGEEESAVDAIKASIDPDPERLMLIANNPAPRVTAVGLAVAEWEKLEGDTELADLDRMIVLSCVKCQIGVAGKDNRARAYLDTLKAQLSFENEKDISGVRAGLGGKR